jgi:hypothetical protein
MTSLRLAVPAVLVAAAVAGCITYFVTPTPQQVEADQKLPPTVPNVTGRPNSGISSNTPRPGAEDHIGAFERAAEAILKRAQNATASAGTDKPLITGPIPLPRRRPILRP